MIVNQLSDQKPFTTADKSTIRSILDATNAPVEKQSLAEASLSAGGETQRHFHKLSADPDVSRALRFRFWFGATTPYPSQPSIRMQVKEKVPFVRWRNLGLRGSASGRIKSGDLDRRTPKRRH